MEIWKNIDFCKEHYQVSSLGNVRSIFNGKMNILSPFEMKGGYLGVSLPKDGKYRQFSVHRLVADAFIPNPENKPQVNHIDENKKNNVVENLEFVWPKENCNHGTRNKRIGDKEKGVFNTKASKPVLQYDKNGNFIKKWPSISEVERQLGFTITHIVACCKGKRKTHKNYIWRYDA